MKNYNPSSNSEPNTKHYLVKIVFNIIVENENNNQFDEQLRYIQANSTQDALHKAKTIGKNEESVFVNNNGKTLHWKFLDVTDMIDISNIENGKELFSCTQHVDHANNYVELTRHKALLLQTQHLAFV